MRRGSIMLKVDNMHIANRAFPGCSGNPFCSSGTTAYSVSAYSAFVKVCVIFHNTPTLSLPTVTVASWCLTLIHILQTMVQYSRREGQIRTTIQWNRSVLLTVQSKTNLHIHFFFHLGLPIVWPSRISPFLSWTYPNINDKMPAKDKNFCCALQKKLAWTVMICIQEVTGSNFDKGCKIWGFHGGDYEEWCLLGCYAMWLL
jgi:hypothetical protein